MYNKLFSKILDSSVWLEDAPTRLVWITMLAAMDQDGFVQMASPANVSHRAIVSLAEAESALAVLEAPDKNSSDNSNDGRRLERVPGGWMVLNAQKYRELASQEHQREQTRERVRRHRERKANSNAHVTAVNEKLTPSEAEADTNTKTDPETENARALVRPTNGNPHAKPTNLINGPELRRHGSHAWCSWPQRDGFCIPHFLHSEFKSKALKDDAAMAEWYVQKMAQFAGQQIGEDGLVFWRNEFAHWIGIATMPPVPVRHGKGNSSAAAMARVVAKRLAEGKNV